jgi:hypothetical protein
MDSNLEPFAALRDIVAAAGDPRIVAVETPIEHRAAYDPVSSAYGAVDAVLARTCLDPAAGFDAFLVTNGDNFYAPDALNVLPVESDLVLMNFHSCVCVEGAVRSAAKFTRVQPSLPAGGTRSPTASRLQARARPIAARDWTVTRAPTRCLKSASSTSVP